jgi:hypothetical protein
MVDQANCQVGQEAVVRARLLIMLTADLGGIAAKLGASVSCSV